MNQHIRIVKSYLPESLEYFLRRVLKKEDPHKPPLAKLKVPLVQDSVSTERCLICIMCQTRGHTLTWPTFKKNVLEELNADLALCIGVDDDYDYSNPFWQNAKYRWTVREYDDYGAGFDEAQRYLASKAKGGMPNWRRLLGIKNQWLGGIKGAGAHPGSAGILIYFRWLLLKNIFSSGLIDAYDRFVVTRSDFMWNIPHPPLSILSADMIWIPNGEYYGGLTDRHMIASRRDLHNALDLIEDIVLRPEQLFEAMSGRTNWNLERYILFHFKRHALVDRVRLFPYVSYTVRSATDETRWQAGSYNSERGMIVKYSSELAAAQAFEGRITTKDDWIDLARTQPSSFSRIHLKRLAGFESRTVQ